MPFIETLLTETKYSLPVDGKEYAHLRFGDYFLLEKYRQQLKTMLSAKDADGFIILCRKIIGLQSNAELIDPIKTVLSMFVILSENTFPDVAFLRAIPEELRKKEQADSVNEDNWRDKDGYFVSWLDAISRNYGWTIEYILGQKIDTILFLIQEIYAREFADKEWQYRLTELAYKYDANSKKSSYQPLPRPFWLREINTTELKKMKIHREMLPFGNVVDTTGLGKYGENIPEKE